MYEIIPNLYLSSFRGLGHVDSYFVVNASADLPMMGPGIRVAINDDVFENNAMFSAFEPTIQAIDEARSHGKKVVIHCMAGQQRSAAITAAYLMYKDRSLSVNDAKRMVRNKKPDAFIYHTTFQEALERWYAHLHR